MSFYELLSIIDRILGSHYKITISISSSEESSIHGGEIGIMSIMITSHANDETEKLPFSKEPT